MTCGPNYVESRWEPGGQCSHPGAAEKEALRAHFFDSMSMPFYILSMKNRIFHNMENSKKMAGSCYSAESCQGRGPHERKEKRRQERQPIGSSTGRGRWSARENLHHGVAGGARTARRLSQAARRAESFGVVLACGRLVHGRTLAVDHGGLIPAGWADARSISEGRHVRS